MFYKLNNLINRKIMIFGICFVVYIVVNIFGVATGSIKD